jgi:hypothetical protein
MSITVNIDEPVNAEEAKFCFPVCGEQTYQSVILPVALKRSLSLVDNWGTMTEVNSDNHSEFVEQVETVLHDLASGSHLLPETASSVSERLRELLVNLEQLFGSRPGIVVLIG